MRDQLFNINPSSTSTLQRQIQETVVHAILSGHIPPGAAVPSCRKLARQLGVARNTVLNAYQQLVETGYLIARERSGYYVNSDIMAGRIRRETSQPTASEPVPDWGHRLQIHPRDQRNISKVLDWQQYRYPFVYGQFDPELFPVSEWRECSRQAMSPTSVRGWARDYIDSDDPLLIEQIRTHVLPRRGVWAAQDEILVTVGAQHALYLIAALLFSESTRVAIEDPGYPDARNIFALHTRNLTPIEIDSCGLVVDERLASHEYVYTTPSHQHPTTVTMTLERRQALLAEATRSDIVIVEDDYESETNYVGEPTPALKSLDSGSKVIYVGSLSKTLAPGLRVGYLVAPRGLVHEARALRRLMIRHPPTNNQRTAALFLSLGYHDALVRRLSHAYRARWLAMGEALERHLPYASKTPVFGGTSYWVRGPTPLDVRILQRAAAVRSILIERGDVHFFSSEPPLNYFRLGFASIATDRIESGIKQLAKLVAEPL